MIYLISAETPIIFVPILLQIYLNPGPTPRFWTDYECAVLKVNALINFESFYRRSWCSKERNDNTLLAPTRAQGEAMWCVCVCMCVRPSVRPSVRDIVQKNILAAFKRVQGGSKASKQAIKQAIKQASK